jgi:hypothetical protein
MGMKKKTNIKQQNKIKELNALEPQERSKRLLYYELKYGDYYDKNQKGLKNFKNLWRMPNSYEWLILVLLILTFFSAWSYNHDITFCRNYINNQTNMTLSPNLYNQQGSLIYPNGTLKETNLTTTNGQGKG